MRWEREVSEGLRGAAERDFGDRGNSCENRPGPVSEDSDRYIGPSKSALLKMEYRKKASLNWSQQGLDFTDNPA